MLYNYFSSDAFATVSARTVPIYGTRLYLYKEFMLHDPRRIRCVHMLLGTFLGHDDQDKASKVQLILAIYGRRGEYEESLSALRSPQSGDNFEVLLSDHQKYWAFERDGLWCQPTPEALARCYSHLARRMPSYLQPHREWGYLKLCKFMSELLQAKGPS
jgi:hypothetical protein